MDAVPFGFEEQCGIIADVVVRQNVEIVPPHTWLDREQGAFAAGLAVAAVNAANNAGTNARAGLRGQAAVLAKYIGAVVGNTAD